MTVFTYKALNRAGRNEKGIIEADSPRHARQQVRAKQLLPLEIMERSTSTAKGAQPLRIVRRARLFQRKVNEADLALMTRQLATLVHAAMPLEECLLAVGDQCEKMHLKSLAMSLRGRIQEGYTLSDSLREHPKVFDSMFCSMVAAGEKSSHLDRVLNRLADYTEQRQRMKIRLVQAMLYPLILTFVATAVVGILLASVVPKVMEQFEHLGQALPTSTQLLMLISDSVQSYGAFLIGGILFSTILIQRILQRPIARLSWDRGLLRIPVINRVSRGLNTARFARTLSILSSSSVPLLESMYIAASVTTNRYIEKQIFTAAERVREGCSLRASLTELRIFPPMMLYMIASGERSGELEKMLEQAANNQDREFETQIGLALGIFEPALIVIMSAIVLFIVIAILQPMLQLNNLVGM